MSVIDNHSTILFRWDNGMCGFGGEGTDIRMGSKSCQFGHYPQMDKLWGTFSDQRKYTEN